MSRKSTLSIVFLVSMLMCMSVIGWSCSHTYDDARVLTEGVDNITSTSATLYGTLENLPHNYIAKIRFKWGLSEDSLIRETPIRETSINGGYNIPITGLTPNTIYYFKAYAEVFEFNDDDAVLKRTSGRVIEFTTTSGVPVTTTTTPATTAPITTTTGVPETSTATQATTATMTTTTTEIPASNLIAEWHFDEGSGTTVYDSSGNDNHGTLMGDTSWADGPSGYGSALSFDGEDDFVLIENEQNFDFDKGDAFTIEAWIKTNSDENMKIIGKAGGYSISKHSASQGDYDPDGGNKIYVMLISNYDPSDGYINTDAIVVYGTTNVADGEWHHVKVTYDGSSTAQGVQIYVDEIPETMNIRDFGDKGLWDTLEGSTLNDYQLTISSQWDGLIDEVKIWEGVVP